MKRNISFVLFFISVVHSYAQESNNLNRSNKYPIFIGVEAGFNLTVSDKYDDKFLNDFLGLSFDFFITQNHSIKTKIKYLKVERLTDVWDWSSGVNDHIASYNAEFIIVPILYKWQFGKSRAKAYVQGGVYFGLETKDEYKNYPEGYDEKFNDFGISLGVGTYFPLFEKGLYFYSELEIYEGLVNKSLEENDDHEPFSLNKTLTNLVFSLGFKYKF